MTKSEHFQFLVLMIPTVLILAAAAVSMADLAIPVHHEAVALYGTPDVMWDDRPAIQ